MTSKGRALKIIMDFCIFIISILAIIFLLPKILIFFFPLIVGYIIACIANPIVRFLEEKTKIVRKHGSAIVIFLVIALLVLVLYGICYIIISQIINLIDELPRLYSQLEYNLDKIGTRYIKVYDAMPKVVQEYLDSLRERITTKGETSNIYKGSSFSFAKATIKGFTSGIISIIFAIMSAYFFTAQRDKLLCKMRLLMSGNMMQELRKVSTNFKNIIGDYFKVQIKIMLLIIGVLYVGFLLFDIKYALVLAVIIGMLDFLPLLGIGAILLPWAIFVLLVGNYILAIKLMCIYILCLIVREVGEPKMFGKSIGLNTYETFFLLYVGFKIGGFVGLVFSIPLGIIVVNLCKAGMLNSLAEDCKYMYIVVDKFRREGKKSIINEIEGNSRNN